VHYYCDPAAVQTLASALCFSAHCHGYLDLCPRAPVLIFESWPAFFMLRVGSMFKAQTPALGIYVTTTEERHQSTCFGELYDAVEYWETAMVASSSTGYIVLVMKRVRWRPFRSWE
jgi:hypothetical protein